MRYELGTSQILKVQQFNHTLLVRWSKSRDPISIWRRDLSVCCCIYIIKPFTRMVPEALLVGIKLITHRPVPKYSAELYLHTLICSCCDAYSVTWTTLSLLFDLVGCSMVSVGSLLPNFQDNISVLFKASEWLRKVIHTYVLEQHISPISSRGMSLTSHSNVLGKHISSIARVRMAKKNHFIYVFGHHCKGQDVQEE